VSLCQTKTARIVLVAFIVALVHIFHVAAVATVAAAVAARLPVPPPPHTTIIPSQLDGHHQNDFTIITNENDYFSINGSYACDRFYDQDDCDF